MQGNDVVVIPALLAFFAGFGSEALATLWVSAVERKRPAVAGIYASAWALLALLGLERALHETLAAALWVIGYGAGAFVVVWWDAWRRGKSEDDFAAVDAFRRLRERARLEEREWSRYDHG